ncbi:MULTISPECIES: iron-sulfur cluster insertion protein ErpA [unclassified Azospirillum]|uniref:iron-sulfur cluster insertion protein ErpA n=1 Tax=unclassified Azospirillum TaxID=2630922 RepID=UPI000B700D83|nr:MULTISPECIES: iron-sulfur cluster insertion protein ErpA [unclassified Azospirillum]SNS88657.1 iron-sulfur cluster insertion protein [Azospirillum sp. RU38E]SNT05773.1 iron-sulfur cluster insertion protein [Azospirillum sp. RU37A]
MSILSENQSDAPADRVMNLTARAAARIAKLAALEGNPDQMLRLTVSGGGCSGFQYGFSFDTAVNEDDHLFARDNAKMVVDDTSLDLLAGAEVDYVEDLMGSYFKINNPNASSSCGCGASFSV